MKPSALVSLACLAFVAVAPAVEFEKDVFPLLEGRCGRCHMGGEAKGGLAMDKDKIGREIGKGKAIVPGESSKSDLVKLISLPEGDGDRMPPKGAPLGEREIQVIKEWIDAGAALEGEGAMVAEKEPAAAPKEAAPQPVHGEWTNAQGKTITATLLRVEGDKAMLRLENGQIYPYPIAQLAPESQAKVKEFAAPKTGGAPEAGSQ
jgi:hypothetical protein